MFICREGKGGKLSRKASKMLCELPGAVYIASFKESLDQSDCCKLFVQLRNYTIKMYIFRVSILIELASDGSHKINMNALIPLQKIKKTNNTNNALSIGNQMISSAVWNK